MAANDPRGGTDPVTAQYEELPYPPRNPADERHRLITGSPSHLDEIIHYVFGGRLECGAPFRALVAGGGTGDGAIMLAQQLTDRVIPGEVVHLDVSTASRTIAEARATVRGLTNIRFVTLSLLDLPASGLGPFDYIDCCGVLHHLADPAEGLRALAAVLAPAGGMGLMVYGELGRTGVYPVQELLRQFAPEGPASQRLEICRRLLRQLPATNWLRRNPLVRDHLEAGDAGLFDLLLHARDRAYRVPDVAQLAAAAGLRILSFIEPAFYDPAWYLTDGRLLKAVAGLPWLDRCAVAEILAGTLKKHVFYAVKADNPISLPDPRDRAAVPVLRDLEGRGFTSRMPQALTATVDGIVYQRALPALAAPLVSKIDGHRSLGDIYGMLAQDNRALTWTAFLDQFVALYVVLNGLGKLYLRYLPSFPADPDGKHPGEAAGTGRG